MKIKICLRCRIEKPVSEFWKHRGTKDGLQPWCIKCKKETDYENTKSQYKRNQARWEEYFRREWGSLTRNCPICGKEITLFSGDKRTSIHFDHTNGIKKIRSPNLWLHSASPDIEENIKIFKEEKLEPVCCACNPYLRGDPKIRLKIYEYIGKTHEQIPYIE